MGKICMPVVVYSDASFDPDYYLLPQERREQPRLGWVFMHHNLGPVPMGRTMQLPDAAIQMFCPRQQQIYTCEAVAVPEAIYDCPQALQGRHVTWFIYNEAACASFIRGASSLKTSAKLLQ